MREKPILYGSVAQRLKELARETCSSLEVDIIKGDISRDHVHLLVSVPPHLSVSRLMQSVKGRSSRKLLDQDHKLRSSFWGCHLWARGCFAASSGNVTDEVVAQYID